MMKIRGLFQLLRVELPLAAGLCTLLGAVIAYAGLPPLACLLAGFLCVFFISASAMVSNDVFDLETDRINAPARPLPSGRVSPGEAAGLSIAAAALGLVAGAWIGPEAFVIALSFLGIGTLYNWRLKTSGLPGNLMVAACVGIMFVFGGFAVGEAWNPAVWTLGALAFLFDLGEEIAADALDVEGDRARGSRSIAILKGRKTALTASTFSFGAFLLVSLLPAIFGWLGRSYLFLLPVMDLYIVFCVWSLLRSRTEAQARAWIRRNYLGVSVCLLAFLLGRLLA